LNRGYAAALRHVAEVIAAAPPSQAPDQVDFTPVLSEEGRERPVGHVILTWLSPTRALRLEFDADGMVDYWCDPDEGPLPVAVDATCTERSSLGSQARNDLGGSRSVLASRAFFGSGARSSEAP
jgi:hypothetical protein